MLSSIIDGISSALSSEFVGLDIYTEPVEQGIKKPCFEVVCENVKYMQLLGNRYKYLTDFKIIYYPASQTPNGECLDKLEIVGSTLSEIQVDDIVVRARNITADIVENKLILKCKFDLIFFKIGVMDKMEILEKSRIEIES